MNDLSIDADLACDVLVVGGGINGAGIARDLAGRGLSVVLCEKDDLASHTSSSSTKLIHGGLRYLEQFEFSLVRKALHEREILLRGAPHIMWPMRFVMPHDPAMRPAWMVRLGIFLYDHLARREVLPRSQAIDLRSHLAGRPLKGGYTRGFMYSDGWVDDARLVVLTAIDARERGATVLTRTACTRASRSGANWVAQLECDDGTALVARARVLVNAAGPWAEQFLKRELGRARSKSLRLVKGSHIVVRKLFDHSMAYIFQNEDKRIMFAIPYERDFTLIGTTDVEYDGAIGAVTIDASEVDYLCAQANRYFARSISSADVVWTYSGVRPLLDDASGDPSAVTRDYLLDLDTAVGVAPLLTVWGGKITTFRKLSEEAANLICSTLGRPASPWTEGAVLPGGDLDGASQVCDDPMAAFERFCARIAQEFSWLDERVRVRLARAYGSRMLRIVGGAHGVADLGHEVAPGLHEAELAYLCRDEWARDADDVLWRRSKLGLHYTTAERERVAAWYAARAADLPNPRAVALLA